MLCITETAMQGNHCYFYFFNALINVKTKNPREEITNGVSGTLLNHYRFSVTAMEEILFQSHDNSFIIQQRNFQLRQRVCLPVISVAIACAISMEKRKVSTSTSLSIFSNAVCRDCLTWRQLSAENSTLCLEYFWQRLELPKTVWSHMYE